LLKFLFWLNINKRFSTVKKKREKIKERFLLFAIGYGFPTCPLIKNEYQAKYRNPGTILNPLQIPKKY
jgi:hypothetical protein